MHVTEKIDFKKLSSDQYKDESVSKSQIYLHHTASGPKPNDVLKWWASTPEPVATAFIIGGRYGKGRGLRDGEILQVFNSSKWAYHLGINKEHLLPAGPDASTGWLLNRHSIGIEICNWGPLHEGPKGWTNWAGTTVPDNQVVELDQVYRGSKYYQKYTTAQLESTQSLLYYLCNKWAIQTEFKGMELFDIDRRALSGQNGIWTHTSVRPDKSDCFPQTELVEMLKSL